MLCNLLTRINDFIYYDTPLMSIPVLGNIIDAMVYFVWYLVGCGEVVQP